MPIQKPTNINPATTSQGGNIENRQQVSRGNFNNTTVTVAGQNTSANEASQHLPAGELSQPSPIPPPRSRRNVRIASRSASFLPPAGASNMSPGASNIPLSANNPLYEPTSDPSSAASNIPPSGSSDPSQTESVYGPVTVLLDPSQTESVYGPVTVPFDPLQYQPTSDPSSAASNIPPTAPLDSSGYEPIEPASPMTLESAGPPRMPLAAASTPPPGSGPVKLPPSGASNIPSGASNVPSGASNIPPTVPLDSSGYEPIEPASPMTLESAGPPRIPVDSTSSAYATVSLPERPEESGMDARVRQSYTELSRRLNNIRNRFGNYTTELTNDMVLVENTVTQPPNPQLSSEEAAAIGRAKATVRNKIHETCIRSIIKELEDVKDGFKNIMDQGDASTRQYMTNSNNINSRMNSVELNIEHLQGRLAKLYDMARSLRNYEAHVPGKAESRLDALPYQLTLGNEMMQSISSSVDDIARTVGVINPNFQIPLNTRLSLPSLKTELQAHKDAIAAYKRDILEGDNGVGARVVQAFQAASRGPNEPGSNISSAAGSITSAIYYWTMYSSLIDSIERVESNIGRLLDQIEPLLPSSQ